jgi:hypothetical protein
MEMGEGRVQIFELVPDARMANSSSGSILSY